MIEIKNLTCKYDGVAIFKDVSLDIKQGEFLVITGPNGSGKTTMLKAMLNLIPYSGEIRYNSLTPSEALKSGQVGYVPQLKNEPIPLNMTVKEYLNVFLSKSDLERVVKLLKIENLLTKSINDLSGGQRQLVNIAKAIRKDINTLILDEPNTGLDFKVRQNLYNLLSEINQSGITVIIISHYLDEISCKVNQIFNIKTKEVIKQERDNCEYC